MRFSFFIAILLLLVPRAQAVLAPEKWRRIYHYQKTALGQNKSKIQAADFFFSPQGAHDPEAELQAAIQAFSSVEKKYGIQKMAAACAFPARKMILEDITGKKFPNPPCAELEDWMKRLNANQASIVFVGAYPGNPASILGHTFLRLYNGEREDSKRDGIDLLSYSVGFMALPDPRDGRIIYMLKGLTGGYDGYYEIEPHYMKVGLYNHSESRDLWDLKLNLNPQEVNLLVHHLWELTFNSKTPYFFIDENCSYRLITMLEAIKPEMNISAKLPTVVLPAETVRALINAGFAKPDVRFRASVKRRMDYKLSLLTPEAKRDFNLARTNLEATQKLTDATAVDALLDYWLYENYRAQTHLSPKQLQLMNAAYTRAATMHEESKFKDTTDAQIREQANLSAPFSGHQTKWIKVSGGIINNKTTGEFSFRSGTHPFWSGDRGYQDITAIEYFGADVKAFEDKKWQWQALFVDARSFSEFFSWDQRFSWSFQANFNSTCDICETLQPQLQVKAGVGVATKNAFATAYLLPVHLQTATWLEHGVQGVLAPGWLSGVKFQYQDLTWIIETTQHWWKALNNISLQSQLTYASSVDSNIFVKFEARKQTQLSTNQEFTAGLVSYF